MRELIVLLLLSPIVGLIAAILLPRQKESYAKKIALASSVITFWISIIMWIWFDSHTGNYQYLFSFHIFLNYSIEFGVDGISLLFVILTTLLVPVCVLSSWNSTKKNIKEYYSLFLLLELLVILVFVSIDLFVFYIFFESVLVPMYLIVGIWGSRERKIHAAYSLFLYTLAGSSLMLIAICVIYLNVGTLHFNVLSLCQFSNNAQLLLWLAFFFAFAVKMPMFPFHIWLPEAHVEAPTTGSVILAGILLKLGGYGFIRLLVPLLPYANGYFLPFVITLSLVGIVYTSLIAIRQIDIKKLIAYTSVAHMNVVVLGIFTLDLNGIQGSILLMISHGIISSALFLLIGTLYDRHHTRVIKYFSGIGQGMPIFSSLFLFFSFCNFSLPGTGSFVGEFLVFFSLFNISTLCAAFAGIGMILGGVYSIWLSNRINGGYVNIHHIYNVLDINRREFYMLFPLVLVAIFMGVYPAIFLNTSALNVEQLVIYTIKHEAF